MHRLDGQRPRVGDWLGMSTMRNALHLRVPRVHGFAGMSEIVRGSPLDTVLRLRDSAKRLRREAEALEVLADDIATTLSPIDGSRA